MTSSSKLKKVYTTAILGGFIRITQNHFKDLVDSEKPIESLVDYYLLCCKQPNVDPLWNITLFNQTVKEILMYHRASVYSVVKANKVMLYNILDPLFNNENRSFDSMVYLVLMRISQLDFAATGHRQSSINIDNPEVSLLQYIQEHSRFTREFIWKHSIHNENLISLLVNTKPSNETNTKKILDFLENLPEKCASLRESHKLAFKEKALELQSIAWAPERVMDWCLTTDEHYDLTNRWSSSCNQALHIHP
jgi:hypothetical protein